MLVSKADVDLLRRDFVWHRRNATTSNRSAPFSADKAWAWARLLTSLQQILDIQDEQRQPASENHEAEESNGSEHGEA